MRRVKLGDVFSVKVPNGYKLFQWAYRIPRQGDFIRVFKGLYNTIPENIQEIVESEHSYVMSLEVSKYYRTGLSEFLGNFEIPERFIFPEYYIYFWTGRGGEIFTISVLGPDISKYFDVSRMEDLPEPYRYSNLLNGHFTPNIVLYLFDNGFDFEHPEIFAGRIYLDQKSKVYTDMMNAAVARDNAIKEERKQRKLKNQSADGTMCSEKI